MITAVLEAPTAETDISLTAAMNEAVKAQELATALRTYVGLEPYADKENTLFSRPYFTEAKNNLVKLFNTMNIPVEQMTATVDAFKKQQAQTQNYSIH